MLELRGDLYSVTKRGKISTTKSQVNQSITVIETRQAGSFSPPPHPTTTSKWIPLELHVCLRDTSTPDDEPTGPAVVEEEWLFLVRNLKNLSSFRLFCFFFSFFFLTELCCRGSRSEAAGAGGKKLMQHHPHWTCCGTAAANDHDNTI